jgi:hypothetical protein
MATIEESLATYLLTLSALTGISGIGTGNSAPIRPDRLAEEDGDIGVIIEVDNENKLNDLTGRGGRVMANVNLVCRAPTKKVSRQIAEAIRLNDTDPGTGLAGFGGTVGGLTFDAWLEDTVTSFIKDDDGSDQGFYDTNCSYMVTYAEVI